MGVRAAARLHCRQLPGISNVGDIENPYPAEPIFLWRGYARLFLLVFLLIGRRLRFLWKSLRAAIDAAIWLLDRHKHQVPVNRHIPLSARTNHRRYRMCFSGIGDVIDIDAKKITHEQMVSLEGEVRVCKRQLSNKQLRWLRHLRGVGNAEPA